MKLASSLFAKYVISFLCLYKVRRTDFETLTDNIRGPIIQNLFKSHFIICQKFHMFTSAEEVKEIMHLPVSVCLFVIRVIRQDMIGLL